MTALALHGGTPVRTRPFPPQNTLGPEERAAVLEVMDSGVLSQFVAVWGDDFLGGPRVRACEAAFAERLGVRHAVAVNSATTGLQVAVAAAGLEPGDEVIVSPFTMSATAAVVVLHDAVPVFADVEPVTYNLDPASVEACVTPRTRGLMIPHIFGQPADMGPLLALAERHGLAVIEDAAQSIGATWQGRESGTIGTAGVLSLNYHKIIHSGEGGIVLTDDDDVALRAQLVRNHGETVVADAGRREIVGTVGSNYRMTEIEAAIAGAQIAKLDRFLGTRRSLAERLTARLRELPGVGEAVVRDGCTHSWYVYPITLRLEELGGVSRDAVVAALEAEGIPTEPGYVAPLYRQPLYQERLGRGRSGTPWRNGPWTGEVSYDDGICPVAERLHDRDFLLLDVCREPLDPADVDDVADAFEKVVTNVDALRTAVASAGG